MMDTAKLTLQRQARALGHPMRHDLFRYLADAARPVDIAELTRYLGLNHNAVRQHLAKLVEAGLVTESKATASGRGRPRLLYTVDASADSRWGVTGPYERLALLMAEIIRTGNSSVDVGRRAGRRGRLGVTNAVEPIDDLVAQMALQGFAPTVARDGARADITLHHCPFETAALVDPDTVCGLHLGLALGAAEAHDGLVVDELVPRDPRRARCRLHCHLDD